MKLFSGNANKPLAEKTAKALGVVMSPVDFQTFPDGERRIRITDNIVGERCTVIQSASTPVDGNYMELFFIVDALRRSGAEYITAVVPYFGYQRQDHVFRDGEAVSLEVVIKILEAVGVDRLISFDMHSIRIPALFHIPVNHLSALPIFARKIIEEGWDTEDTVLVSPDMGGIARVKKLSELLDGMSYAAIEKDRDLSTGVVSAKHFGEGDVKGKKRAFLVDDMISSGKTIIIAAEILQKHGIEEIYVFATHPVFSTDAPSRLEQSIVKKVYVTNTVFIPSEKQFSKLRILSVADQVAKTLNAAGSF